MWVNNRGSFVTVFNNFGSYKMYKYRIIILIIFLSLMGCSSMNKKKHLGEAKSAEDVDDQTPLLTQPKVKKIWVKDEIKGKRYVMGHWEYILEENSEWAK